MTTLYAPPASPPARESAHFPPPGPLGAARRHLGLTLLPAMALLALAMVVALVRTPTHTAEARLVVGRVDVPTQSIPGLVQATQSLASSYSRLIDATEVVQAVALTAGVSESAAADRLSASPIPESPIIRIEARGSSEPAAVALGRAGTTALIDYVRRLNAAGPALLRRVRDASLAASRAELAAEAARAAADARSTTRSRVAAAVARADADAARLRLNALRSAYASSEQALALGDDLRVVSAATSAVSDRVPVLQRLAMLGLVAGLVLGVALATLRERRRR